MKNLIRWFFMWFLMMGCTICICKNSTFVQAAPNATYIKFGDINFDSVINEADTELIQQHMACEKSDQIYTKHPDWYLKGKKFMAADVNADGKVDTTDELHVLRHISTKKGENYISNIITVTLMNEKGNIVYNCFPVIYYWGDTSKNRYPYLYTPSKIGYEFKGWYSNVYPYGSRIESYGSLADTDDHVLYARWEANHYYLKFDANGGSCSTSYYTLNHENSYGILPTPSRKGFTFTGWYTKQNGGSKVSSNTKMAAGNMTVYAHWKVNTYTVTFDSNGGNLKTKTKKVTYGKKYGKLPKPSKPRYTFQGWYTQKSSGKKITSETKVTVASNQKLYAHWKASTKIKLNKTSLTLRPKQTYQLKATITGEKKNLKWTSSNPNVVSVNSNGKITAQKTGSANITITVNGFKMVCKVTVANPPATTVNFKSLRGRNYSYKNSKYSFGIGFAKSTNYVYIGVWNLSGTSSSYEDFYFKIKEGTYSYSQKGMRSHYIYDITIKPYKDYIKITMKCQNSSYNYFNISGQNFKITANTTCSNYAEQWSTVEIKDYLHGAGEASTIRYTQQLVDAIGGMKAGQNTKYPDLYFSGNNMVIGVNNNPVFDTSKDEYVRIENNGNTAVFFYGVKIGDTRSKMEEKFSQYNIRTWNNGKTYSNANAWEIHVTFKNGKLEKYIYLCKPTS